MNALPLSLLFQFVNASVSGGYVVALAVICLLQYVIHIHHMNRARRERERCQTELDGMSSELAAARRDGSLRRQESQTLREFLNETDCAQAIRIVLRRLVSNPDEGCAICLRRVPEGWSTEQSLGLSEAGGRSFQIDPAIEQQLNRGEPVVLNSAMLRASRLWNDLPFRDRQKIRELYLFGIGAPDALLGVMATTGLFPTGHDVRDQVETTTRLISGMSGSLRDRWRLNSWQDELRTKDDMLALRSVSDRNHESPLQMITEFISLAASKVGAVRVALFLCSPGQPAHARCLARDGNPLQSNIQAQWFLHEERLAAVAGDLPDVAHFATPDLERLSINTLIGSALLVPIRQQSRLIGLLCLTRSHRQSFSSSQQLLSKWSAEALAEMIPRAVNQAVVAHQARFDSLTQLANRGTFDRNIEQELAAARDSRSSISLLLFDLDRFKGINDRHGHRGGDAVLRQCAAIVRECVDDVRLEDRSGGHEPLVARYGGEELAVILPRLPREAAERIGENIRRNIAAARIAFDGASIAMTISGGLACFPDHADSVEGLISAADAALYQAKDRGRNRLEVAEPVLAGSS